MFDGRLNRLGFFLAFIYILVYFLVPIILQILLKNSSAGPTGADITSVADITTNHGMNSPSGLKTTVNIITALWGVIGLPLAILVSVSTGIRRWHDLNQSGFLVLLNLIPLVGFITLIIQLFFPGTKGPNKYGEPDSSSAALKKVLFGR
ncbi:hypothetical protein BVY00_00500 [bacterium G20]|nr:hypothetical protein BVY00_00500 [bacterium G20]